MSVVGYMGLLDLGIGSAMVRYVAVADGSQDRQELGRIMSTSMVFFSLVGLLACTIFALLGLYPQVILGKETTQIQSIELLFYIFAFNAVFLFPMQVFLSVLLGLQFHYFINFARIVLILLKSGVIYYYIANYSHNILIFISIVELVYNCISFLSFYFFMVAKKNVPKFSLQDVSFIKFKDLFVFGSKNLIMMTASRLQNQSVPIIITYVLGVGNIVYYAFPNRLVEYAKGFSLAVGYPLTPYFSARVGKGDGEALRTVWLESTFVLQIIMCIMPIMLWQYGEVFLRLWIGQEYAIAGRWVLNILIVGLIADILAVNAFRILTAQGTHGRSALLWLLVATCSVPAGILGGVVWGVEGIALGAVSASVAGNVVTLAFACATLHISLKQYVQATCSKLVVPLIITVTCCVGLSLYTEINSFFSLILQAVCVVGLYALCVWVFSLDAAVKQGIRKKVRGNIDIR